MIEVPNHLVSKLGAEMKMDVHWVDVKLKNGLVLSGLVVRGGRYITGRKNDPDGIGKLQFSSNEVSNLRREALFRWWPFW